MEEYNTKSIKILEGLEAVRKRPGMYIGSISQDGLHHLLWEIIDNSIDEALAGYCSDINIYLESDNKITVSDNGRGIPVGWHEKSKKYALETVLTTLHAGGKFNNDSYKISGGLHGVGSSVVNALSSFFNAKVKRNNKLYEIEFENGGKITKPFSEIGVSEGTGTEISFIPDDTIFNEGINYDYQVIKNRVKQLTYLNNNITINLFNNTDPENKKLESFHFSGGIKDYVNDLVPIDAKKIIDLFYTEQEENKIRVQFSFVYTNLFEKKMFFSFCNNINTPEGGTHEDGLIRVLKWVFNKYYKDYYKSSPFQFSWDDISEGIVSILSIQHQNPQYEGQTKKKLGNSDAGKAVYKIIKEKLTDYLLQNPKAAKIIIDKIVTTCRGRIAGEKAKEQVIRKNFIENKFNLFGKLSDCRSKNVDETELFLVEGDSAGGNAKTGRDNYFQAILPLKGKVLNIEKTSKSKAMGNKEIQSIITAIGTGGIGKVDLNNIRYGKIIIMTDADVDGSHIRILLLTLFYRYFRELIVNENIYIAQPPLYKINYKKTHVYLYNDNELIKKREELVGIKFTLQRYKGLGEMNPDQLWKTTMDPDNRYMKVITIEDAIAANQIIIDLMGDEVENRKVFIDNNARTAKLI